MNYRIIVLTSILSFSLSACVNEQIRDDSREALTDLGLFVDSVENNIEYQSMQSWETIEDRYGKLEKRVENEAENLSDEAQTELNKLDARFEVIKSERKEIWLDNLNKEAKSKLAVIEDWVELRSENTENTANDAKDAVEENWEQNINWLEDNYENLKEETQEEFDKMKEALDSKQD